MREQIAEQRAQFAAELDRVRATRRTPREMVFEEDSVDTPPDLARQRPGTASSGTPRDDDDLVDVGNE